MSTVSLGGVSIGYDDVGAGQPLVLVHGHPFNRSMWRPQTERFSRAGWRVIAPDLRGYGQTPPVADLTPLGDFARDLAALLDHLGVDRIVLGGLSMGGQIVMEFARLFPQRVGALMLADTTPAAETADGKRSRNQMADQILREGIGFYADSVLPMMVAPHNIEALPDVAEHVLAMMHGTSAKGAAAALRGRAERPDYVDLLGRIEVPTLVIVGSDDEFTPVSEAEFMHERLPNSTLVVIDGAAHMPNLERAEEFNAALQHFLQPITTAAQTGGPSS